MDSTRKAKGRSRVRLLFVVFAAYSLHFCTGAAIAWPSPVIPRLNLTSAQNGLINSLFALGQAPGQLITSLGMDLFGRKPTLFLMAVTYLTEWIFHLASASVLTVFIGRFIGGMGMGGSFSIVAVYIAEIAEDEWRGPLNSVQQSFLAVGMLVVYTAGPLVDYYAMSWIAVGVVLFFMMLFAFAPESPHYLLAKGRGTEAAEVLRGLRGREEDIFRELAHIKECLARERSRPSANPLKTLAVTSAGRRGLCIGLLLLALQQGSAINSILAYMEYTFDRAHLEVPPALVPILVGLSSLVSSLPVPLLVRLLGYKALFFISNLGAGLSLGMLGIHFCLLRYNVDTSSFNFLPVLGMVLFYVFFCIALGPLAWSLIAELYAPSVKSLAVGICGVFSAVFGFLVAEVFTYVLDEYGFDIIFFGLGVYLVLGAISCLFFVPDTSKMTLQEIQDLLSS